MFSLSDLTDMPDLLQYGLERFGVPGASMAVLSDKKIHTAYAGVTNLDTQVGVTEDTIFQIGSITKVYTASLILLLAGQGKLRLDDPLCKYLPELFLADGFPDEAITIRRLLTHSSGLDGDLFCDTGRGSDCLEKYVSACLELPQIVKAGAFVNYSNAAYVLLGRVIEKLSGSVWDEAIHSLLLAPLNLNETITLARDICRYRAAVGHINQGGGLRVAKPCLLPRSGGPAGARLMCSARDLLAFAQFHLANGLASNNKRVLTAELAVEMQCQQIDFPFSDMASAWGLGWMLFNWDGAAMYGHDGTTIGQRACLRVLPERNIAVALLGNSDSAKDMFEEILSQLFGRLAGLRPPSKILPGKKLKLDLGNYTGCFRNIGAQIELNPGTDGLQVSHFFHGLLNVLPMTGSLNPFSSFSVRPVNDWQFASDSGKEVLAFIPTAEANNFNYLHFDGRAYRRVNAVVHGSH